MVPSSFVIQRVAGMTIHYRVRFHVFVVVIFVPWLWAVIDLNAISGLVLSQFMFTIPFSQNERGRWRVTQLTALDWTRFPLNFPWAVRASLSIISFAVTFFLSFFSSLVLSRSLWFCNFNAGNLLPKYRNDAEITRWLISVIIKSLVQFAMGTPSSITESDSWTKEAFSFPAEQRSEHYKNSWSTTVLMLMDYVSTCANLVSR